MPIFYRPYYLDATCTKGDWDVLPVENGYFVYHYRKFGPVTFVLNPQLTPYLGYINAGPQNTHVKPGTLTATNLRGYPNMSTGSKYTYVIDIPTRHEVLFASLSKSHRRYIKKTQKQYEIVEISFSKFCTQLQDCFESQSRTIPFPIDILRKIDAALAPREERKIMAARDSEGNIHSVIYLVHDEKCAYLLASGYMQGNRSNYALVWQSIIWAHSQGKRFDFEGSMLPGVERFYAGFGGKKMYCPVFRDFSPKWLERIIHVIKPHF